MDLIFGAEVGSHRRAEALPARVLSSIADYHHRATTTARPMSLLIPAVMAVLLSALAVEAVRGGERSWVLGASAALAGTPILSAVTGRCRPRYGSVSASTPAQQSRLARSIRRDQCALPACRHSSCSG